MVKALSGIHIFLCSKSNLYHKWHHNPHHQKVHSAILASYSLIVLAVLIINIFGPNSNVAAAATADWNINTSTDYTYDDTKTEFASGVGQLKAITPIVESNGIVTTSGNYTIHTFTTVGSSNTFTATTAITAEVLVVGGGGGGGYDVGGGGGAGGLLYNSTFVINPALYTVTVGAGGPGSAVTQAATLQNGQNSVFSTLTAIGGGGGANYANGNGALGGSGGGATGYTNATTSIPGAGTSGQGNSGGAKGSPLASGLTGSGGGGAGGVGQIGQQNITGFAAGGLGLQYSISGSPVTYATGGRGGGDSWLGVSMQAGAANTGNGGDGAGVPAGKAGGSGIVIIRYSNIQFSKDAPTITPNTGQGYNTLASFTATLGTGSTGTIKYQLSADNGSTWYWWNGTAWAITSSGYTESNIASDINTRIAAFNSIGTAPKVFKWRAYLSSDGSQQPKLDHVSISYVWDTGAPNNVPAFTSAKSQLSGGVDLPISDGSRWYPYATPSFTWADPGDTANAGETQSGLANYYVCFNTNETCHPTTEGTSQTGTTYTASNLVSGNTYYFRMRTKDAAGNYSENENQLFTYKYDGDKPVAPKYVAATSGNGYANNKSFSFIWPTANSSAASDTGGSGLRGYQYRINDDPIWYGTEHTGVVDDIIPAGTGTITLHADDLPLVVEGLNTFYLRAVDYAGNISEEEKISEAPFYYSAASPSKPLNLTVNPETNTLNNFSFSWSAVVWPAGIAKYYYSINTKADSNSPYTVETSLLNQAVATKQGPNTLYLVAQDKAGNINWVEQAEVTFFAYTPAPGIPENLQVSDQSVRAVSYKTSLSWAAPSEVGIGVHHYNIYRKNGDGDYTLIASPTGRYYLDETVSPGVVYLYKVGAVDSANQNSADSTIISITPKGTYTTPARIVDGSTKVIVTSRTATISWQTETNRDPYTGEIHTTDSMVAYGKTKALESTAADRDFSSAHLLDLKNLEPDTIYYYQVLGVDENGNRTEGPINTFQTEKPTVISKVEIVDLRQTTAILKWESSRITTTELNYGKSTAYGVVYKEGDIPNATTHTVFLKDLDAGTQYHFQIQGKDQYGDIIKSDNYTLLKTLEFPKITNVTFQPLTSEASTTIEVNWTTNIPTDGRVSYASTDGLDWREEYDGAFKTDHKFKIGSGKLLDKKTYLFKALVRDQYGNEVTSETQTYTTPEDTRPPVITNLQTEVSVEGAGDTAQVSAVVTWETDEPSDSQVFYGEGTSGDYSNSSGKDSTLVTSHLVVLSNIKAAQTYHVKAKSADKSGNLSESNAQNFVTNQAPQSVINIILTRLQQTFGWMGSINGIFGN